MKFKNLKIASNGKTYPVQALSVADSTKRLRPLADTPPLFRLNFPAPRPGKHVAMFYDTAEERREGLFAFFDQAIQAQAKILYGYNANANHTPGAILAEMRSAGLELAPLVETGQLVFLSVEEIYLCGGRFDPDRMMELLHSLILENLSQQNPAVYVCGEMSWALEGRSQVRAGLDAQVLAEYESRLNLLIPTYPMMALCLYDRNTFPSDLLLDMLLTHPYILLGGELHNNHLYVPPSTYLGENLASTRFDYWLSQISERCTMEKRLSYSERLHQAILHASPDCILLVDPHGQILFANEQTAQQFGFSNLVQATQTSIWKYVSPAHQEGAFSSFRALLAGEEVHLDAFKLVREDGSTFFGAINGSLMSGPDGKLEGVVLVIRDVTRRKQIEAALQESEDTLRALINTSPSISMLLDRNGCILAGNDALSRQYGRPLHQVIGHTIFEFFPPEYTAGLKQRLQHVIDTHQPYKVLDTGPQERLFDTLLYPVIDPSGQISRIAVSVTEITSYKQAEAQERAQRLFAETLRATSEALAQTTTLDGVLDAVLDNLLGLVPGASVNIMLTENGPTGPVVRSVRYCSETCGHPGSRHAPPDGQPLVLPVDTTRNLQEMLTTLQPLIISDTRSYTGWLPNPNHEVRSQAAVPIGSGNEIIGFLCLESDLPEFFTARHAEFLRHFAGQAAISIQKARMFEALQESHTELTAAYEDTIQGWARALELRDKETEGHSRRVVEITCRLAERMGFFGEALDNIRWGAQLHDIGKMGIPDSILLKPGPLLPEEWVIMRQHPRFAYEMLSGIPYLRNALEIPLLHHERWNGSGYPYGLQGVDIPVPARIFAIVDAFDALLADRPYRPAWPLEEVMAFLRAEAGSSFDPQVVENFFDLLDAAPQLIINLYEKK